MEKNINPKMLVIDQKISRLMDQLEHPNEKVDISTIDLAEKVTEIEQQVMSDSMSLLVDDVKAIKKMLGSIQKKAELKKE